jgi:hypothetical protein
MLRLNNPEEVSMSDGKAVSIEIGRIAGLRLTADLSAIIGSALLWILLSVIGTLGLGMSSAVAITGGLVAMMLHWCSDIVHQLGHARAARATGHPMIGIRLWGVLGASVYPREEGSLPASVHIRRALGGAPASLLLSVAAAAIALAVHPLGGVYWWVALFFFLDNLLVLTLGSLLPLGFTDGSTLLHWWRKQGGY